MFKQSSIVLAALFASASAIKFQPSEFVDKFEFDPSDVQILLNILRTLTVKLFTLILYPLMRF